MVILYKNRFLSGKGLIVGRFCIIFSLLTKSNRNYKPVTAGGKKGCMAVAVHMDFLGRKFASVFHKAIDWRFYIVLLFFCLGTLMGCIAGLYLSPSSFFFDVIPTVSDGSFISFLSAFWKTGFFFGLVFLCSTSFLGFAAIPIIVFFRGYLLSCSVAALYASGGWRGILCAFIMQSIPAFLLIPCFLLSAAHAAILSFELLALRRGTIISRRLLPNFVFIVVCVIMIFCSAAYTAWVVPLII